MQHAGKPIDRVDGFGGGFEAIQKVIDQRSKDDWGGGKGTGGASGKISDGPASFEEVNYYPRILRLQWAYFVGRSTKKNESKEVC